MALKEITKQKLNRNSHFDRQKGIDCSSSLPKQKPKSHKMKKRAAGSQNRKLIGIPWQKFYGQQILFTLTDKYHRRKVLPRTWQTTSTAIKEIYLKIFQRWKLWEAEEIALYDRPGFVLLTRLFPAV